MAYEAGTIIEARVQYQVNGQKLMNVLHYVPGVPGEGTVEDLIDGFLIVFQSSAAGTLIGAMKALMSNDCNIYKVTAQAVFPTRYRLQETDAYDESGTVVADCDAQNVQLCVTKKGRFGNRHNIGSFHLGGLPNTLYKGGLIDEVTFGAAIGNLMLALQWQPTDEVNGITYFPHILNKSPIPGTDPVKYEISGSTQVVMTEDNVSLRTMRRRTIDVGE